MEKIYSGIIINPLDDGKYEVIRAGALVVDKAGRILFCGALEAAVEKFKRFQIEDYSGSFIIPGLIDSHVHLPQFPAIGCGDGELLDWLNGYIFPLEERFREEAFAKLHSERFFNELLSRGTTTAFVYSAPFKVSACEAFKAAGKSGIRAYIGRTMMDERCPDGLAAAPEKNIADVSELMKCWHEYDGGRLNYVMTPRFAGSCSFNLMKRCADIAKSENLYIQTHLSENLSELAYISGVFPDYDSYTDIYLKAGLVTEKSLFGHCVYLSETERQILKDAGSIVVHCPTSNRFLQSGAAPIRNYLDLSLKVALGTDISAGYSPSVLREMSEAVETSKTYNLINPENCAAPLTPIEAFSAATLNAAKALGLDSEIGNFAPGKSADFAIFSADEVLFDGAVFTDDKDIIAKLIYTVAFNRAKNVYVRGKALEIYL